MALSAATAAHLAALEAELQEEVDADDVGGLTFGLVAPVRAAGEPLHARESASSRELIQLKRS